MIDDPDRCYAAVHARDPRFDGWFVVGVTSTGIYCRPSCPARTPARDRVAFHPTAAAAHLAGFRACKRCRPDATPGSPAWDHRGDVVARAMRLIADGAVDRWGVGWLAAQLGYSSRHLHRQLVAEVGAGPLALARAQRAQTARILIETTALAFTDVAFAAGFRSVRQFNDTVREVFATTPTVLRRTARHGHASSDAISLRLAHRTPASFAPLFDHLAARAVTGVEEVVDRPFGLAHRRSLTLPHGGATATLAVADDGVRAKVRLDDLRDLTATVTRLRRLCDLDADPVAVDAHLGTDPALAPSVAARPGTRLPGSVDGFELAVRAVLGQQVSIAAARAITSRLVELCGATLRRPDGAVTRTFPTAAAVRAADLDRLGIPAARAATLRSLAAVVDDGEVDLDVGTDRVATRSSLLAVPGIGPWTQQYVALRALHDPDAFPATDLVLRRGAAALGLPSDAAGLTAHARRWRPWRAYAAQHLWNVAPTVADLSA